MLPTTHWNLPDIDKKAQSLLVKELGINSVVSQILVNRDILTPDDAEKFFSPSLQDLHNPFLMKDMEQGVTRVVEAIRNQENIVIYGDYDADGITSTVLLVKFLNELHTNVTYYIPDRIKEGYGLNKNAIDKLREKRTQLIITVDCGISNHDEISYAKPFGIDTIVLDHHEVPDSLPDGVAVINPHRHDCQFPFKGLAGVGVVFNFIIALRGRLRKLGFWQNKNYPNLKRYLDIVALGTIGDMCPLIDENRIFVKTGLDIITEGNTVGLQALRIRSGLEGRVIDSEAAGFNIIPRINAAGRIGSPEDAVELLLTNSMSEALRITDKLDVWNRQRQEIGRNILNEVLERIESRSDISDNYSLVFASSKWHPGVIGIVASRLVDKYYRPTVLISIKDGIGKGSGRSIAEYNLYEGLRNKCSSSLISFGGHRYAAGISIKEENIGSFCDHLENAIREDLDGVAPIPQISIDACCALHEIDFNLVSQIEMLAPFGNRNPKPVLCVKNIKVTSPVIVRNNHLKMRINESNLSYDSIWFSKGDFSAILSDSTADIAFTPQINRWLGEDSIQLKMKDISPNLKTVLQ